MRQEHLSLDVVKVVIGTTNPAKIAAVDGAIKQIWPQASLAGITVHSGVRAQPLSDDEAIIGATNRAQRALAAVDADLGIGIEGNTVELAQGMFSTAWVIVVDRAGTIGLGSSGRFLLPTSVAQAVRQGGELGPLMDEMTGEQNTKHKQGAVGILTNNLIHTHRRTRDSGHFSSDAVYQSGVLCAVDSSR